MAELGAVFAVAMSEAKAAVDRTEGDLVAKLRAAMKSTRDHWLVTDEETEFKAAVGAVMTHYGQGSPEWERISAELEVIKKVSALLLALQAGIPVDLDRLQNETLENEIGLRKLWAESRQAHE